MLVEYIVRRQAQPYHSAGEVYPLDIALSRHDQRWRKRGPSHTALGGSETSIIHRVEAIHSIMTDIYFEYGITNIVDMREFLRSMVDGTQFTVDFDWSGNMVAKFDFDNGLFEGWDSGSSQTVDQIDEHFARAVYNTGSAATCRHTDYINATAAETITGSCWYNAANAGGDVSFGVSCYNSSFSFISDEEIESITAATGWTQAFGSIETPALTAYIRPYIKRNTSGYALMTHPVLYRYGDPIQVKFDGDNFRENRVNNINQFNYGFRVREL